MKIFLSLFVLPLFVSCSASYQERIAKTETAFYSGNYEEAIPDIREIVQDSENKDRLLYLMEAGIIFHTKGDYEKSVIVFEQAEAIADTLQVSALRQGLSFVMSDEEANFRGEDFERVLIKFYLGLNKLMLKDHEASKRYFKKVEYELKEMKFSTASYRQNLLARYINAIVSEYLGKYNDARVQYKLISQLNPEYKKVLGDRYILALKEKDLADQKEFAEGQNYIEAYDAGMQPIPYREGLAEVIIIHQAGKSAVKVSRGRLFEDKVFGPMLRSAIEGSLRMGGTGLSLGGVTAMFATAENPIPKYETRDTASAREGEVYINGTSLGKTTVLNNYSETAIASFEENYSEIVAKNVASIATKFVASAATAYAAKEAFKMSKSKGGKNKRDGAAMAGLELAGEVVGLAAGLVVSATMSTTIKPDLRCWRLIPSNFQVKRIFIEPGTYQFSLRNMGATVSNSPSVTETVEAGKPTFLSFRTF